MYAIRSYYGCGIMKVGDFQNNNVCWTETFEVKEGDCFSISSPKA